MSQAPTFAPAVRHAVKARIALAGPSGSGKTYTALLLAAGLANGNKIAVIDTEKGSASLYADEFSFDTLSLGPPFSPERYVEAIKAAHAAGYDVLIVDSLSHAWADEGGVLDIVDKEAAKSQSGNKFAAWRKGTPEHQSLINALIRVDLHVIVTMRTKTDYVVEENERGRQVPRKVGLAPIQREGVDYEFHVFGELTLDHTLSISKSRYRALQDLVVRKPGAEFAQQVLNEVMTGEPSEAKPGGEAATRTTPPSEGQVSGDAAAPHGENLGSSEREKASPETAGGEGAGEAMETAPPSSPPPRSDGGEPTTGVEDSSPSGSPSEQHEHVYVRGKCKTCGEAKP